MERQLRALQGPRPTALKTSKDSHKIKKLPQQNPPPRPPVIIYTVSPKIIHTSPTGFMSLVQRLTGSDSTTCPPPSSTIALSPAARLAVIEKTKISLEIEAADTSGFDISDIRPGGGLLQSILPPGPAGLLQPLPRKLFSPISDPSPFVSLYHQDGLLQQDYVNSLLHQIQYDGTSGDGGGWAGGGMISNMILPSLSSTTAFLSPNPMLSPASIEFLTRLLDQ